jgi:hypothetical protein
MRDIKDLRYAFGQADDGFIDNVYHILAKMHKKQAGRPVIRRGALLAAVIVTVAILSAGTALALTNTWGILDFLSGRRVNVAVLPEASAIVQTEVPQEGGETELASFSVREAVYDGHDFYIIVDVKPTGDAYLLLGPDAYPQDPVGNMGPLFGDKTGTIADYAETHGKEMIQTNVSVGGTNGAGLDFLLQQDGTLTYMISGSLLDDSDSKDLELTCIIATFEMYDGKEVVLQKNIKRSSLNISLENTGISGLVSSIAPAEYADCGVRIDSITLKASELAVYAEISYTVIDKAAFDATDTGLCFEFIDSEGNRLPDGAAGGGGTVTEDGVHYIEESSLGAMETLPREITVRAFNCWEKNRYETHTFELK